MINNVSLTGRLTKDLEIKKTNNNKSVLSFTLAVNRSFDREQSDFIRCQAWNKTAEIMSEFLGKGSLIGIEGRIQTGSYEDKDSKTIYTTDVVVNNVVFLESKQQAQDNQSQGQDTKPSYPPKKKVVEEPPLDITSEDLPF